MAISTQPQYTPEPFKRAHAEKREDDSKRRWQLKLGVGQLIVSWAIILGVMVAVYFSGLYSGEDHGLRRALDEHAKLTSRLPVLPEQPEIAPAPSVTPLTDGTSPSSGTALVDSPPALVSSAAVASGVLPSDSVKEAPVVSPSAPISSVLEGEDVSAGFLTKPADVAKKPNMPAIGTGAKKAILAQTSEKPEIKAATVEEPSLPTQVAEQSVPTKLVSAESSTVEPKAKKTPTPAVEPVKQPGAGWYVQVAAVKDRGEAQSIASRLRAKGYALQLEKTMVKNEQYLRVLVGPYRDKKASQLAQRKISDSNLSRGKAFLRQIR